MEDLVQDFIGKTVNVFSQGREGAVKMEYGGATIGVCGGDDIVQGAMDIGGGVQDFTAWRRPLAELISDLDCLADEGDFGLSDDFIGQTVGDSTHSGNERK